MQLAKINKNLLSLMIVITAIAIFFALISFKRDAEKSQTQEKAWTVNAQQVKVGSYSPNLILYGRIESPRNSRLEAAVNAYVLATPVLEGASIKKGQLLVQLDDRDTKLSLQQRQAEVDNLSAQIKTEKVRAENDKEALAYEEKLLTLKQRAIDRQQALFAEELGSEQALDNARQDYQNQYIKFLERKLAVDDHKNRLKQLEAKRSQSQALLQQAKLDVERTKITAPFDGRLSKLAVSVGDRVQQGEMIVEVFDTHSIEIRAQIPTQSVSSLRKAVASGFVAKGTAQINNQTIHLQLERLAGKVEQGRGGIDGLFAVTSHDASLTLGRAIAISLQLPMVHHVISLPSSALYGANRVYQVVDGRLKSITIKRQGNITEPSGLSKILVQSPQLKNDDWIITTQLPTARSGMLVKVLAE